MSTQQPTPYPLRMPPDLRSELEARAKNNGRSLNAEILALVHAAISAQPSGLDMEMFAEDIAKRVADKLAK